MNCICKFLLLLALPVGVSAQPLIINETTEKIFYDDFTDGSSNWQSITNEPNIKTFVVDGYYYMERLGSNKSRALMASYPSTNDRFMIKTALMLGPATNENQTVGVLFLAQSNGGGGFVFEINRKEQFRVRGILSAGQYITTGEEAGWVKSKHLLHGEYNKIVIKAFAGKFDFYINDQYSFSFQNSSYKTGELGLLIGPEAKGKVDYFYVYKLQASIPEVEEKDALQKQIDVLKMEKDSLQQIISTSNQSGKDAAAAIQILENQLEAAHLENKKLKENSVPTDVMTIKQFEHKIDSLEQLNSNLQELLIKVSQELQKKNNIPTPEKPIKKQSTEGEKPKEN